MNKGFGVIQYIKNGRKIGSDCEKRRAGRNSSPTCRSGGLLAHGLLTICFLLIRSLCSKDYHKTLQIARENGFLVT